MWETSLHLAFSLSFAVLLGKKAFLRRKEVLFVTEQQDRTALGTWEESLDGNTFPSRSGSPSVAKFTESENKGKYHLLLLNIQYRTSRSFPFIDSDVDCLFSYSSFSHLSVSVRSRAASVQPRYTFCLSLGPAGFLPPPSPPSVAFANNS